MRKCYLLILLVMMMTTLAVISTSCYGPQYLGGPTYSSYYSYPSDYSIWYGPNFAPPVAWNLGTWSSYPRSGYFPVDYVARKIQQTLQHGSSSS